MESEKIVISAQIENDLLQTKIMSLQNQIILNNKLIHKFCKHHFHNHFCLFCNIKEDAIHNQDHTPRKNNQIVS